MPGIYDGRTNGKTSLISRTRAFFHPIDRRDGAGRDAAATADASTQAAAGRTPSTADTASVPSREDMAARARQAEAVYGPGKAPANVGLLFAISRRPASQPTPPAPEAKTSAPAPAGRAHTPPPAP